LYGVAGAGAAFGLGRLGLSDRRGHPVAENDGLHLTPARRTSRAFGTAVSVAAWHTSEFAALEAVDAAFRELALVEELMSIYRPDSQLSRLNNTGVLDKPHPYLVDVLRAAEAMSGRSQGAFDITIQPLWSVFAEARQNGMLPSAEAIERARKAVDWRRVVVSADRIRLLGSETQITLNGIAQGYAADRAAHALTSRGVLHALIDAGEIGTIGAKPSGESWSVGVQHPRHDDAYLSLVKLHGRCLATSGDYATTFSDDFCSHHLFDPRTGRSPAEFASVSVAAASATMADALSTAVFVLGVDKGLDLIESTAGADALVVLKDGRTLATRDFPQG
jgi:thiamine biosynthesis lipoprotein